MNSDWQLLLVSNKLIFIWAATSALHSRFFVPMLFPVLQKELRSGRAARFADSNLNLEELGTSVAKIKKKTGECSAL